MWTVGQTLVVFNSIRMIRISWIRMTATFYRTVFFQNTGSFLQIHPHNNQDDKNTSRVSDEDSPRPNQQKEGVMGHIGLVDLVPAARCCSLFDGNDAMSFLSLSRDTHRPTNGGFDPCCRIIRGSSILLQYQQ